MSLSRDRFRHREWKCPEKYPLIKGVSKIATVNYPIEHLLFVKLVEELLHADAKSSPFLDKMVQLELRLCTKYLYVQVTNFLMLSRLFGHHHLRFERLIKPALYLLQYVDGEPANNYLTAVPKVL